MLRVVAKTKNSDIATVYVAQSSSNKYIEFVESIQPPFTLEEKWVLIISTLYGCPVNCPMCDAGGFYQGKLSAEEILAQVDYLVAQKFPDKKIPCKKFKIQFARMGEPTLNPAVLEVLEQLPQRYQVQRLLPSVSTVAPVSAENFLNKLCDLKNKLFAQGNFQMQFSIHTTDENLRDQIIPTKKWSFAQIGHYGKNFYQTGDQKITLNFALSKNNPINPLVLKKYFDPEVFIIKITPINPTISALKNNLQSYFVTGEHSEDNNQLLAQLRNEGYQVILSIGELEENKIGSNCGQYVRGFIMSQNSEAIADKMYTYGVENLI